MQRFELNHALARVTQDLQQSTVEIYGAEQTVGAGVIWSDQGLIVTNAHVLTQAQPRVVLADQRQFYAQRIGLDQQLDLAILKIKAEGLQAVAPAVTMPRVGELLIAVGHPLGTTRAVTLGMVHQITPGPRWICADIHLAPGNSGGPLATMAGQVVGINTQIAAGQALAVPVVLVEHCLARLANRGVA